MSKLEPALLGILARRHEKRLEQGLPDAKLATADGGGEAESVFTARAAPDAVHVLVKFTGDVADLRALGFKPLSLETNATQGWSIAAGPVATDRLADLGQLHHVLKIEASRPMTPELDKSLGEIKANQVQEGTTSFKGSGVVIGIIDTGIDWSHHSFRKPDGTTRVLAIWDQELQAENNERSPDNFPGIGVEYKQKHINATLIPEIELPEEEKVTVRSTDRDGHGTHVAGIAAGDGSQAGNCSGQFTFIGVAPEADIIVVVPSIGKALGESPDLVNALDYIWGHPAAVGKPVVINLSMGDNLGPHDGTSLVEQMIDSHLQSNSGHMVVKSAGNEAAERHHAQVTIAPKDSRDVSVQVSAGDRFSRYAEIWYDGTGLLRCTVTAPTVKGPASASPPVDPGKSVNWIVNTALPANRQTVVRIDSCINDVDNHDNSIHLEWDPAAKTPIPSGEWKLRLANTGTTEVAVDLWLERQGNKDIIPPVFSSHSQVKGTITIPGTARTVITVGAYSQSGSQTFNASGSIAEFSSQGPTRDGVIKPDISAPGVGITSARSGARRANCCCDCCLDSYVDMDGTSMAAPHVTGVVALMYQKNPGLTASQLSHRLKSTARIPDGLTPSDLPNTTFGAGKVDARAAVAASPPPGGHLFVAPVRPGTSETTTAPTDRADLQPEARDIFPEGPSGVLRISHPSGSFLAALHAQLLGFPGGTEWAIDMSRHFSEVRGLINHNRRVAVAWHRMQGPALVAHLAHLAAGSPQGVVLPSVACVDRATKMSAFFDVLEKYGTAELVATVRRRRTEIGTLNPFDIVRLLAGANERAA